MRLIDADWLEEHMNLYALKSRADVGLFINAAPTIEGRPQGKWKPVIKSSKSKIYKEAVYCSKCGYEHNTETDFCPNCGADMREEDQ